MTVDDLLQKVLKTKKLLRADDSPQTLAEWDSFAHVNVIATLEDTLGVELTTNEVVSLTSIASVIAICQAHGMELTVSTNQCTTPSKGADRVPSAA